MNLGIKLVFTKNDLAKYPFLKEAAEYVKEIGIDLKDLSEPKNPVVERAEKRLQEAILFATITGRSRKEDIEILSFPIAVLMAAATKDSLIRRRYALAEAKRTYNLLKKEPKEKLIKIAENFGWKIQQADSEKQPYQFKIHFTDYLRNTGGLREKKWKLVNRLVENGNVYLTQNETARLLAEEVRRHIESKTEIKELPELPENITEKIESIKNLAFSKREKIKLEEIPKEINIKAFPPCIKALYDMLSSGRHLSHIGRFTLTSFLVNIGMPTESIVDLFRNLSDFNERLTRYQVEHIAGERGSRTRYTPPKCETLKTHGVCQNPDELCERIRHPLSYYRKKIRREKEVKKMA